MATEHDSGYKFLFSTPELVRDLILGFVPDEWLHRLDYRTLEIVPGSYVTEDLSKRSDDIVWRVKVGGEWVYLYLLIEFQSGVDKYMALRMMVYVGLLYQALIKQGQLLSDDRLPPVLPIVLYNGSPRWTAATDVFHLGSDLKLYIVQSRLKQKPHSRDVVFHNKLLSILKETVMVLISVRCPGCHSDQVVKCGKTDQSKQRYRCQNEECSAIPGLI